jgi:hypothetical protein
MPMCACVCVCVCLRVCVCVSARACSYCCATNLATPRLRAKVKLSTARALASPPMQWLRVLLVVARLHQCEHAPSCVDHVRCSRQLAVHLRTLRSIAGAGNKWDRGCTCSCISINELLALPVGLAASQAFVASSWESRAIYNLPEHST